MRIIIPPTYVYSCVRIVMYIFRCHIVQTEMRTIVVVDVHDMHNHAFHLVKIPKPLMIQPFHLKDAVDSFRHGVLLRVA